MESFGRYDLLSPLACGGMAELFVARQRGVGRVVVLKRILPHLARDDAFQQMFREEARIAALLNHPNIMPVYDVGRVEKDYFIAMPMVVGVDLSQLLDHAIASRQLPLAVVCDIVLQASAGLAYAHAATRVDGSPLELVHRDISPGNLMLDQSGRLVLLDFGVASARDTARPAPSRGAMQGKLAYMSPEQCRSERLDQRSDIYSLGVIFHELVTARRLFWREGELKTMRAVLEGPVPSPDVARPDLPRPVTEVILRAIQRAPEQRFASATELRRALQGAIQAAGIVDADQRATAQLMRQRFGQQLQQQQQVLARQLRAAERARRQEAAG